MVVAPEMVPTSLLAHITATSACCPGWAARASRRVCGWTRPSASTSSQSSAAPWCSASHSTVSRTAWCSTAETAMRVRRGSCSRRAQYMPLTARLSASVPPPVRMTSAGSAPRLAAICSRAVSTAERADRPAPCRAEALPPARSWASMASRARGSTGVVAAWSR
ncbi:Uncharacterised protein [Mycobacteroides abscessus subsp. abscessus]|nr:Uncharacterised protein [Mycobacteroides abscessus subsp. abscessus]